MSEPTDAAAVTSRRRLLRAAATAKPADAEAARRRAFFGSVSRYLDDFDSAAPLLAEGRPALEDTARRLGIDILGPDGAPRPELDLMRAVFAQSVPPPIPAKARPAPETEAEPAADASKERNERQ